MIASLGHEPDAEKIGQEKEEEAEEERKGGGREREREREMHLLKRCSE